MAARAPPTQPNAPPSSAQAASAGVALCDPTGSWDKTKRQKPEFNEDIANASSVPEVAYSKDSVRAWWKGPRGEYHGFNTEAESSELFELKDLYERLRRLTSNLTERSLVKTEFFKLMLPHMEEAEKQKKLLEEQAQALQAQKVMAAAQEEAGKIVEAKDAEIAQLKESLVKLQQERDSAQAELQVSAESIKKREGDLEASRLDLETLQEKVDQILASLQQPVAPEYRPDLREDKRREDRLHLLEEFPRLLQADRKFQAESGSAHALARVKAFYPRADIEVLKDGWPSTVSEEEAMGLIESCGPVAETISNDLFWE